MFKIIGIGNQLMCDDGIASKVLNEIKDELYELSQDMEIICGETDFMYCLDKLHKDDIVIVVDSSNLGEIPGTVKRVDIDTMDKTPKSSQHQKSLLDLIPIYHEGIKVYAILIEVFEVKYQYGLSEEMSKVFFRVCFDVFRQIKKIIKEHLHA